MAMWFCVHFNEVTANVSLFLAESNKFRNEDTLEKKNNCIWSTTLQQDSYLVS